MDTQEGTQQGNVSKKKTTRTRRTWKKVEEDALIKVMVGEFSDKWSAENGFKPGFFTLVERELEKLLPESHLKASPHIESKVKYWRQTYYKIYDILQLSGFGWDDVNKRVNVEESVWNEYEKAHPQKAKEIYGKRFPYYEEWTIVFGKDRATGALAEDPTQMEQEIPPTPLEEEIGGVEDLTGEGFGGDFYQPLFDDDQFLNSPYASMASTPTGSTPRVPTPFSSAPTDSTPRTSSPLGTTPTPPLPARRMAIPTATTPPANAGAKKGKKRTRMGEDEETRESMNTFCKESLLHMDKMANAMGYEKELAARRSTIPAELEKLDLTLTQEFRVAAIIGEKDERVYQFLNTHDEKKQAWVEAVLKGEVYGPV